MVNFKKHIGCKNAISTDVFEIYRQLDRSSDVGDLRESQKEVLRKWKENYRDRRDTIVKLHTGEGKTLIGLLILLSKLNEVKEPCVYLCPNNYLIDQTCEQARRFGIPYVTSDGELPDSFINAERILITSSQKMFNGKTKFGLKGKSIDIGSIVLDDSHLCVETIQKQFKLVLKRDDYSDFFHYMIDIFSTSLKKQGTGTFIDIKNGTYEALLKVPYWDWNTKYEDVQNELYKLRERKEIKFGWPILKNLLDKCSCIISGKVIEIYSDVIDLSIFGSYYNAKNRIMMSATISDDSVLVKDLDIDIDTIKNPLTSNQKKWSGEKMILIPENISSTLKRNVIRNLLDNSSNDYGTVILTPSFEIAEFWKSSNSIIADKNSIYNLINNYKNNDFSNKIIIANRYDGIDLPDSNCRILVIDGLPMGVDNYERYLEEIIPNSQVIRKKYATKLEQAFGRSVRGEKDYSAIIVLGSEVNRFLRSSKTKGLFTTQTRKQIEIGINVVNFAKEELNDPSLLSLDLFKNTLNQLLKRDLDWKAYYEEQMNSVTLNVADYKLLEVYQLEKKAEKAYALGNSKVASGIIQSIVDKFYKDDTVMKGYFLERCAKYLCNDFPQEYLKYQEAAYNNNRYLLKPDIKTPHKKRGKQDLRRIERIRNWMSKFDDHTQVMLDVNRNVQLLSFGISSEKFEKTLNVIGKSLGFIAERPEKTYKDGPDNIWIISNNEAILFEAKNQVKTSREVIYKSEAGQISNSCGWFRKEFIEYNLYPRMIINAKSLGSQAHFNEDIKIIDVNSLEAFKMSYFKFYESFMGYDIKTITDDAISRRLIDHKLEVKNLVNDYCVEVSS